MPHLAGLSALKWAVSSAALMVGTKGGPWAVCLVLPSAGAKAATSA